MLKGKKQQDKDRVFGFLKKYITLSMISILLVVSIVFFSSYQRFEISRVTGASISSLLQMDLSCGSLFDSICKLALQIYNDSDVTSLVNGLISDISTAQRAKLRFNSYSLNSSNIISVYIYNNTTDCFYTTHPSLPKQSGIDFFDKGAVELVKNARNIKTIYLIPRKIKLYGVPDVPNNTINVYTFIYYGLFDAASENYNRAIMINVSEEWVLKYIESWNKDIKGDLCIMNEKGIMVSSLYKNEMLLDMAQEEFASKILETEKETGYFVCKVSDAKSFVTYTHSGDLGWYFVRIIPYDTIYGNLINIGLTTVLLLILYIAIGFVISYIMTGRAKRSIDDIIDGLKKEIQDNRTDMDKLKDEFLFNNLKNNIFVSQEQMMKDFEKYKIVFAGNKTLYLILFRIDRYYELSMSFKSYDIILLKQTLMKIASEIFRIKYAVETVDMKDDHIIIAFNDNSCSGQTNVSQIDATIKLVQESAENDLKLSLSAVLGPSGYTFSDINLLYMEARQASNYRLFFGHRCIIRSEDLRLHKSEDYIFPAGKEKMLLDALMLGKVVTAGKLLDEILDSTRGYTYMVLNSLLLRLVSSISGALENIESISKYPIDYNFNSFMTVLNRCETIDEMKSEFYDMFNRVFTNLEQKKNSKYTVVINKAIDIINQEYANEGLCLNNVAGRLGLSPNYLSKLFKTYTAKSVGDYINQLRVEKALKLLEESDLSINEIASRIGIPCNTYFYPIFKKIMGITPAEYRQLKTGARHNNP
ncbi:MAG: helix-turn-helix domain-containing protein [Clostridiaceae bacterium]